MGKLENLVAIGGVVAAGPIAEAHAAQVRSEQDVLGYQNNAPFVTFDGNGKTILHIPTGGVDHKATGPSSGDAGRSVDPVDANSPELQGQKEQLSAQAMVSLSKEQAVAMQLLKTPDIMNDSDYILAFNLKLDGENVSAEGLPAVMGDPNTDFGKLMQQVMVDGANFLKSTPDGTGVSVGVRMRDYQQQGVAGGYGSPLIFIDKDLDFSDANGQIHLTKGSVVGYGPDGRPIVGVRNDSDPSNQVVSTDMTPELQQFIVSNLADTVDTSNIPANGDWILAQINAKGQPFELYAPGIALDISALVGGVPPTKEAPKFARFEVNTGTVNLNVLHMPDSAIPNEILSTLGPWKVRLLDTGWIFDSSKAKQFQKYTVDITAHYKAYGATDVRGYLVNPDTNAAKTIVSRFGQRLDTLLKSPEYQNSTIYAIDTVTGKTVALPHYTADNLPVVVFENHDPADYGAAGNPKGEEGKTAYTDKNLMRLVRTVNSKTGVITVKRYLESGPDGKLANVDPVFQENFAFFEGVEWGYVGTAGFDFYQNSGGKLTQFYGVLIGSSKYYYSVFELDGMWPMDQKLATGQK